MNFCDSYGRNPRETYLPTQRLARTHYNNHESHRKLTEKAGVPERQESSPTRDQPLALKCSQKKQNADVPGDTLEDATTKHAQTTGMLEKTYSSL